MNTSAQVGALAESRMRQLSVMAAEVSTRVDEQLSVVLTAHTIAEAYADAVLARLIDDSGYESTAFGRAMYAMLEDRIFGSWKERHDWLVKGFGVNFHESDAAKAKADVLTLADLRNAIVHGNGRLTERQSRDVVRLVSLEKRLRVAFDVRTEGRTLHMSPTTGRRALATARTYIGILDQTVRAQYPSSAV